MPQCQLPVFCCFLFQKSQKMNILRIGRDKSQSQYFTEGNTELEVETKEGLEGATHPGRVARPGPCLGVQPPRAPPRPPSSPIRIPRYLNPKYPINLPRNTP